MNTLRSPGTTRNQAIAYHVRQAAQTPKSEALLEQLTQTLVAVYRFGSFGTVDQCPASDIDLGVQADRALDPVALFHTAQELAMFAGRDVDLVDMVDMVRCSTVMCAQIVATNELIFCSDRYRCDLFATTAYSRYAHLNEARCGILEDIRTRGSIHG